MVSDDSVLIIGERRKRGRPRAAQESASVSTWIPTAQHDALIQRAKAQDMSVSAYVRTVLVKAVDPHS